MCFSEIKLKVVNFPTNNTETKCPLCMHWGSLVSKPGVYSGIMTNKKRVASLAPNSDLSLIEFLTSTVRSLISDACFPFFGSALLFSSCNPDFEDGCRALSLLGLTSSVWAFHLVFDGCVFSVIVCYVWVLVVEWSWGPSLSIYWGACLSVDGWRLLCSREWLFGVDIRNRLTTDSDFECTNWAPMPSLKGLLSFGCFFGYWRL